MEWLTIFHVVVITQCSLSIYGFPQQVKMNIDGNPYGNAFENVKDDVGELRLNAYAFTRSFFI